MKTTLTCMALLAAATLLRAESDTGYVPESRGSSETFTSKVVRVYSFQEGDAEYVSYVVNWRDHEVVVSPMSPVGVEKRYNVGDMVRCQMQQLNHRLDDPGEARIMFMLLSPQSAVSVANGTSDPRLDRIRAEIEARRARRVTDPAPEPKTP